MGSNRFSCQKIKELSELVFRRYGYTQEEAGQITDVLITADLFGIESHGCQRLTLYTDGIKKIGRIKQGKKPEVVRETALSALIDAHEYMGQIAAAMGTKIAIEKAGKSGMAIVCVKNSNHFGIAGYYARMIAQNQMFGMAMTNSEALMVPTNGRRALIGTNPIAVAMPAEPYPFLMDIATTVVPRGKLEVCNKKGRTIPEGWAVDDTGEITADPKRVTDCIAAKKCGGILPLGGASELFGGHKGYGLGMMVEIMTGIFSGGVTSDMVRHQFDSDQCSHMFLAIDYGMFGERSEIETAFQRYLLKIRNSELAKGATRIYTHGQKEMMAFKQNLIQGIYLNDKTVEEITALCRDLELPAEDYLVLIK